MNLADPLTIAAIVPVALAAITASAAVLVAFVATRHTTGARRIEALRAAADVVRAIRGQ